jgi:2-acylglycerol O-acyltransferase 2
MATTMSAPLNAEPANPDERQQQNLAPKSYANAVEEPAPLLHGTNGTSNANGTTNGNQNSEINGSREGGGKHKASVLRIVDTSADTKENHVERPEIERQESKQEYSATVCDPVLCIIYPYLTFVKGLDDTPRSPRRNKHRKATSRSSNESQEKSTSDDKDTKVNGDKKKDAPVFEKIEGEQNGSKLITVKPAGDYAKQLRTGEKQDKPRKEDTLASGKKAGARWEKSAIRWAPMNVCNHSISLSLIPIWARKQISSLSRGFSS